MKWRNWDIGQNKMCDLCSNEIETLEHFLLDCTKLQIARNYYLELQRPINCNKNEILAIILLLKISNDQPDSYFIDMIQNLWTQRNKILNID